MKQLICSSCKNPIKTFPSRLSRKKYCSKKCFNLRKFNKENINKRFWEKVSVKKPEECWLWKSNRRNGNYAHFRIGTKSIPGHRFSYIFHYGKIPNGLWVLHKCDVKKCVNPNHLFLGNPIDNVTDMILKGRKASSAGEYNASAKLNEKSVKNIKNKFKRGKSSITKMAKNLGVDRCTVADIIHKRTWKHI